MLFWNKKKEEPQTIHLTDENFDEIVIQSKAAVIVDFWAQWCGPCKILGPIIDQLAIENKDKPIIIAKVNTETCPKLSQRFKIKSIPTIYTFKQGKAFQKGPGMIPKPELQYIIDDLIQLNEEEGKSK